VSGQDLSLSEPRPISWSLWGNRDTVDRLRNDVVRGHVRHAYLFGGPDGIGKTTLAEFFCQALFCQSPPEPGVGCGTCLACRKIARAVHPDVQTFSLERQAAAGGQKGTKNTSLTIETVRELCATAALRPMEGRWRVILVEDAETLQGIAQEALLKNLEEPPAFMVMILLANDAELLLPTIRSRCQLLELRPVPAAEIRAGLESIGVKSDAVDELASLAGGIPGWARRAVSNPRLVEDRRQAVSRALDWVAASGYERIVTAVRLGDGFTKRRSETFADLNTLLGVWRDALLLRAGLSTYLTFRGTGERLAEVAAAWPLDAVHRAVRSVQSCIADLESNVRPRLALEAMVLQWPTSQPSTRR
jgi:DNA polymerase-3 subunit delta'